MKTYDLAVIGHVSLDYNIDCRDLLTVQVGGAVVYSSAAAHALGRSVVALTKLAPADEDRLSVFTLPREDIVCLPSSRSTSIENKYFTEDKEKRRCVCLSQGDPFTPADIPGDISAGIWQLGGLIYGDFAEGLTDELARRGDLAVDVQGYLRHSGGEGKEMFFENWADRKRVLPSVRYLKTDAAEAEILTGLSDRRDAAKALFDLGAREILITPQHRSARLRREGVLHLPHKGAQSLGQDGARRHDLRRLSRREDVRRYPLRPAHRDGDGVLQDGKDGTLRQDARGCRGVYPPLLRLSRD